MDELFKFAVGYEQQYPLRRRLFKFYAESNGSLSLTEAFKNRINL